MHSKIDNNQKRQQQQQQEHFTFCYCNECTATAAGANGKCVAASAVAASITTTTRLSSYESYNDFDASHAITLLSSSSFTVPCCYTVPRYRYLSRISKISHFVPFRVRVGTCRLLALITLSSLVLSLIFDLSSGVHAAPQSSCILCDNDDRNPKDPRSSYEEFLFEHQVTRQDAIQALKSFNASFYAGGSTSYNSCKSVSCTKQVMKYCLGPQFINDHCWCELGRTEEGLPFVPHICYVGEKIYTASVGSCFFYEEVKECCCAAALAKQWRHISGVAARPLVSRTSTCEFSLLLVAVLIHRLLLI